MQGKFNMSPYLARMRAFFAPQNFGMSIVLTLVLCGLVESAMAQDVFINELHYDNASTDVGEAIEIAGPAGTDLTGWSLVLYNGSTGASYNTTNLSGLIPNQQDGLGTVAVSISGIQNGAPDGIALVDAGSNVVQFLSYEGAFTAVGGPADSMTSTDIGVVEGSSTLAGDSLQLTGSGSGYLDFSWTTPQANTFGAVNTGQTFAGGQPVGPDFLINEVDADQVSTDSAEFVELFDGGIGNSDLSGLVLVLFNGSDDASYLSFDLDGFSTNGTGYFVLCGDPANVANCDLDVSPSTNLIQNGADAVALFNGDAADFPNDTPVTTANLIDAIVYDTGDGDDAALLVLLNAAQPQVDEAGGGDPTGHSNQRCSNGSGGARNTDTYSQFAPTPGAENTCPVPPVESPVMINEVDADQTSTDSAEFVELFDGGIGNTDLSGLVLVLLNGSDDASYLSFDLDGQSTDGTGYFVLCGDAANVANCDLDVSPNTNLIQNGADAVALYLGDAADFPNDTPVTTTNLIDAIVYDTNDGDDAALLVLLNAAQPQVNEGGGGNSAADSNQRCPNGSGGARNTDTYEQFAPTPGADNICEIPVVGPLEIFQIQGAGPASPNSGQKVLTKNNVVTALASNGFFMQTPTLRSDDDVDTSDGIFVFTGGAPTVVVGDMVEVTGNVVEFFDFTEFTNDPVVTLTSPNHELPDAVIFDASTPGPDPMSPSCAIEFECYEGMLVEIADGSVTGPNQRFSSDPIAEVHITAAPDRTFRETGIEFPGLPGLPVWDGNPEVFELDPDKLGLPNQIIPAGSEFSATGVIGFEFGDYELWPTSLTVDPADIPNSVRHRKWRETTVGSLNLFRLFDDVDDPPTMNVFGETIDDFVVSSDEYQRRLDKFARYIVDGMKTPDILGVQEVESLSVLEDLADAINGINPWAQYRAYVVAGNDIGGIDVGFLIRKWRVWFPRVTQLGADETYLNPEDGQPDILHDRPPLLLKAWSGFLPINVMVVHNRSLGGIETERVQLKRFEQAQSIAEKVQDIQSGRFKTNLVVLGDFNAFEFTDSYVDAVGHIRGDFEPADNLLSGPDLVEPDLLNQLMSLPETERYSFIFRGNAQTLDHALTNMPLDLRVRELQYARGNADAAVDLINDDTTALRASDHDGFVLYIYTGRIHRGRWW
jgi:endonuclease/exonuclease/phosphatase family metal-dependent hydrolase